MYKFAFKPNRSANQYALIIKDIGHFSTFEGVSQIAAILADCMIISKEHAI